MASDLKIIVLLFPDAGSGVKAGRGKIVPTRRPRHFPHSSLVSILEDSLACPGVT